MNKRDKQLQTIRNNPKDVKFKTIQNILLNLGFTETVPRGGSSHYTYHKSIYRITIPKDNPVNGIYIRQVIKILDALEANQ
ncbi:MAG: hypothetical protein FWE90_05195 [Defluviitaleaceae bacterium]|nr:hypothetical protein [Defluviitaleaceae bacterium]